MAARFDLLVIGGGPGGYVAALRGSQLGLSVGLVEADRLGGVCANVGCIPTKTLLHISELWTELQGASKLGITVGETSFDLGAAVAHAQKAASRMSRGVSGLLAKAGVRVFEGRAAFEGPGILTVNDSAGVPQKLEAPAVIIATGARPRALPMIDQAAASVWTSRDALAATDLPKTMAIVGGGAIGMEFASFYRAFGVDVTVIEQLPQILAAEDAEVAALARKAFERRGLRILTNARVEGCDAASDRAVLRIVGEQGKGETLEVERVLVAAGIVANTEGLGLDRVGVTLERGHIVTDEFAATAAPGVYAIGDVTAGPWLAHKASREAVVAVNAIAEVEGAAPFKRDEVPACTYTLPQVASIGLTEAKAEETGRPLRVGRARLGANGKATAIGAGDGLVKTIFDAETGELLGAHLVGAEATELIATFAVARSLETTEVELAKTIFAHPTVAETIGESVLDAFGLALHG